MEPLQPQEGEKVGAGIVLDLISTGGSARVYRTWIASLELHRAVKVMDPNAGQEVRERFLTEARITSKLLHPHIVQIYNYGETQSGLPYLEMEYIPGQTLDTVLQQRGALPLPVALAVIIGVLKAVSYAHTINYTLQHQPHCGVMHRDIKPANVIFARGVPKLMDFGIARPVTVSLHTIQGKAPVTVPYMPPETCTGGDPDFRSDIYQVGLLLYECISGQMAYPQTEMGPIIDAIKTGQRQPLDTNPKAAAIVERCLKLDPENRYQTALECLSDVRSLYLTISPHSAPDELIPAYFENKYNAPPKRKTSKRVNNATAAKKRLKLAAVIIPSALLSVGLVSGGLANFKHIKPYISAYIASITTTPMNEEAPPQEPPAEPPATTPQTTQKPPQVRRTVTVPEPTTPPPEDALHHINTGNLFLADNKPIEALASYQLAIKTPSTAPRQEIIRQSLYGTAKSNSILFSQDKIPATNYVSAWRAVQNVYPTGSPEHSEAANHISEGNQ